MIEKWLCSLLVEFHFYHEDVSAGPCDFYEVVLWSQELRDQLLDKLPIFYMRRCGTLEANG